MIHSMTAFAAAELAEDTFTVSVEIRTYNSRHLDIAIRLRPEYQSIEKKIKDRIHQRLTRGRVEIHLKISDAADSAGSFDLNSERADAFDQILERIKAHHGWTPQVSVDFLIGAGGILEISKKKADMDVRWPSIDACLTRALSDLVDMRKMEGDHIASDIMERLDVIDAKVNMIQAGTGSLFEDYQKRLEDRIRKLTDGVVEIEPARIAQEAALLADRSDISEEIVRSKSHVKQFHTIMSLPDSSGRRLNFLIQELNREFNTMGAKVGNAKISHEIVEMKSELEKIREQVQNIE